MSSERHKSQKKYQHSRKHNRTSEFEAASSASADPHGGHFSGYTASGPTADFVPAHIQYGGQHALDELVDPATVERIK
eukprot:11148744-Karenia_brevis.AAC.1